LKDTAFLKIESGVLALQSSLVQAFQKFIGIWVAETIDYAQHAQQDCADGRFLMSSRGMAVSNTRYLSISETRVNAGIRAWKLHLSEST
jgi:hypothetical protein